MILAIGRFLRRRLFNCIELFATLTGGAGKTDTLNIALAPVLVERGTDPSVVMIAFTGHAHQLQMRVYDFFANIKGLGYSRILLRDQYRLHYHHGIDRQRRDFPGLIEYLRTEVTRLGPKKVICLGASSGGYAALVVGHQLGADYVHAFAPQTFLDVRAGGLLSRFRSGISRLAFSKRARKDFFDLRAVLGNPNGNTRYFVHYGSGHDEDRAHAERIAGLPGVVTLGYPCNIHGVSVFLAKYFLLGKFLDVANQERIVEIAREQIPAVEIR